MEIKCPKCEVAFNVGLKEVIDPKQKMTMELSLNGDMVKADVLGNMLTNFSKLQKAIGKEVGVKTSTYVSDVRVIGGKIAVDFVLLAK